VNRPGGCESTMRSQWRWSREDVIAHSKMAAKKSKKMWHISATDSQCGPTYLPWSAVNLPRTVQGGVNRRSDRNGVGPEKIRARVPRWPPKNEKMSGHIFVTVDFRRSATARIQLRWGQFQGSDWFRGSTRDSRRKMVAGGHFGVAITTHSFVDTARVGHEL
jgi:hypothetical protein